MEGFTFKPIGTIFTPYAKASGMPIQAAAAAGVPGRIEVFPEYREGLEDLEGFSHLILLYVFHLSRGYSLRVKPFLDDVKRGVFATRAPARPNPIGLSVVRLEGIEGETLHICDVDILNGTPLLDIKPFVPELDHRPGARIGWLEQNLAKLRDAKADGRFLK